ncbi:hypothetical protein [Pseudoalteromonas sp. 68 DY56-GL68]|uniref:hypothetical protein n=1 Tax=Pseudoalteromonas sp. 68 DY56-GL68 TaxID=2974919 RepID=UPI00352A2FF4
MTISLEKLVLANMFVFMALAFLFVVLFTRISIKYINKQMLNDSVTPPLWDKGIGASAPFYAMAIFFKRSRLPTPIFDGRLIAKYARSVDKVLAFLHLFTMTGFTISVFTAMYLDRL